MTAGSPGSGGVVALGREGSYWVVRWGEGELERYVTGGAALRRARGLLRELGGGELRRLREAV